MRIEARAWNDPRYATLARLQGFADADHALIKCARIWAWQTASYSPDNPTYAVDQDTIESILGPGGAASLVRAKLAEETPEGYRMKGTEGQIEWRSAITEKRQRAGQARAAVAKRDALGRLTSDKECNPIEHQPAHAGVLVQHITSTPPAQSSALSLSLSPLFPSERDIAAQAPPKTKPAKSKKPAVAMPDGWKPERSEANERAEQAAKSRGVNLRTELEKIRDWALSNAISKADWNASWRNWTRSAKPELPLWNGNAQQRQPDPIRPMDNL